MNTPSETDAQVQALMSVLKQIPSKADCALCREHLDEYVQAQLSAAALPAQSGWVAQHLDSCLECAEAYALLYEVALAEEKGALPQPTHLPEPDLAFLTPSPDWLATLKTALRVTPAQLALQLSQALNRLLTPPLSLALTRSLAGSRYDPKLLELNAAQANAAGLPFSLVVYADRQQPDRCLVEMTVQPPDQSWPDLGGYLVTAIAGEQTFSAETDDWGAVSFSDVPLVELENLRLVVNLQRSP